MKNKVLKIAIAIVLIIVMTMSDFIFLGKSVIAYAEQNGSDATNHANVKFSTYFKSEERKLSQSEMQIDSQEKKLYMNVSVKNEGYFDGVITLENSNFKLKQEKLSEYISSIEENKITLNRVRAGESIEIEVGIEPVREEKYGENMLEKISKIKLTGSYKDSTEKNINIDATKNVVLSLLAPSDLETALSAQVITNKIFRIGEESKRMVQVEINSTVLQNAYPIKTTNFEVTLPKEAKEIEVIAKETSATDGNLDRKLSNKNYSYDKENSLLKIAIENKAKDGNISWKQGAKDSIIVTFVLPVEKEITEEEYLVRSKVNFYGEEQKEAEKEIKYNLKQEANGIIRAEVQNKEEIYKGKMYSREEREYLTQTNIEINYANLVEANTVVEKTTYKTDTQEKQSNIEYKTTTINKAEIEKILGEEGTLTLKNGAEIIAELTSKTEANEEGNIVINYNAGVKELTVEITKSVETGIIRLKHTKVIKEETYAKDEITAIKGLVEKAIVKYNLDEEALEYNFEKVTELKETKTLTELTVVPTNLSTAVVNEEVKFAVTLRTDNEKYDLYKNPIITIKLPDYVKNIELKKANALYLESMQVSKFDYFKNTKELKLQLQGEQTKYNGINNNMYIEILLNIELEETVPSRQDEITLTYTNEKAVTYENEGKVVVPISIIGINGLVSFNKITNYNVKTNSVTSKEEQVADAKMNSVATEANAEIALVNNTGEKLTDVKVLGNLPVDGEIKLGDYTFENTIGATLKNGINVPNGVATVYYTANKNATKDLGSAENGWTTNLREVTNPVLYMIVIPNMETETNFIANYTMRLPANLQYNKDMKTTYTVDYVANNSSRTVNAVPVGLETGKIEVQLLASVGGELVENGSVVRAGEVIRYTINVTNTGGADVKNVNVSALVPEGTVYVEPTEDFVYTYPLSRYYDENADKRSVETIFDNIAVDETKTIEYEVRVKSDVTTGTAINQATAIYNDNVEVKSNEVTNNLEWGNIRVTVKRVTDASLKVVPSQSISYFIIVENISKIDVENLKLTLNIPDGLELCKIEDIDTEEILNVSKVVDINSLPTGECKIYKIINTVKNDNELERNINITAKIEESDKTRTSYRSNSFDEVAYGYDINIEMSGTREGEYLNVGDIIEFNITIINNSKIYASNFEMETEIPKQLSIQKIEVDGEETKSNGNNFSKVLTEFVPGQTINIKITAIVNYHPDRTKIETISTSAKLIYLSVTQKETDPIVHYLNAVKSSEGTVDPDNPPEQPPVDPVDPPKDAPVDPDDPDNPPVDPDDPDNPPVDPDDPDNPPVDPDDPNPPVVNKYSISGKAWVDRNGDGELNKNDAILKDIKVKLLDLETNQFLRNNEQTKDLIVETDDNGAYLFTNIKEGKYIVVFEYDTSLYRPTEYQKQGVQEANNSNVVAKKLAINGQEKEYATTNEIVLNQNISNINMGLAFTKRFDIKIDKYITKLIVQTSQGTTTYDYRDKNFARVEINAKRIVGSSILVQYTIRATNIGDVDAYINSLVDYIPNGLKFNSELNKDWYELNGNLYTSSLMNTPIEPGKSKEVNLILTKTKTDGNAELINNMAEIQEAYNIYGIMDTNSETENKNKNENDLGSADLLISIQTGSAFSYIAIVMFMIAVIGIAAYIINKTLLHVDSSGKEEDINAEK